MSSQDAGGMALPILQGPAKHKDPVCGMMVVPEKAAAKVAHAGKTYYFCSKQYRKHAPPSPTRGTRSDAAQRTRGVAYAR